MFKVFSNSQNSGICRSYQSFMMYWFLYNLSVRVYLLMIWLASLFNSKAKIFLAGRKEQNLKGSSKGGIWIHVSSLGEFEQARPLIEQIKKNENVRITLTFFSPSGFEVRKNYDKVDRILYIPVDTRRNAVAFLSQNEFDLAIFVKYDFWMNHLKACIDRSIPVLFISVMFRRSQVYFNLGKRFYLPVFKQLNHFFVQDSFSEAILHDSQIKEVTRVGDTRVDRVIQIANEAANIQQFETEKIDRKIFVIGSAWESDRKLLTPLFEEFSNDFLFIVAPHDISEASIQKIIDGFKEVQLFSNWTDQDKFDFLVIDNIGMLASLYRYADYTYVGGAFKGTLHNTLEAAAHGKPVFFGSHPNNKKFKEAEELVEYGGGFEIQVYDQLKSELTRMLSNEQKYQEACAASYKYIRDQSGATEKIYIHIKTLLK